MKLAKRVLVLVGVMVMLFALTACGSTGESTEGTEISETSGPKEVKVYNMDGKYYEATVDNLFRDLYIEDEQNYTLIIQAYNSDGSRTLTTYYCEKGTYTTNEDGTITLKDGDSIGYVQNGDAKWDWSGESMDNLLNCDNVRDFTLNEDGTWSPVK